MEKENLKTPVCPGCGQLMEMSGKNYIKSGYFWRRRICKFCGWEAPAAMSKSEKEAEQTADIFANRRPLQKPLTAEEIRETLGVMWIAWKCGGVDCVWANKLYPKSDRVSIQYFGDEEEEFLKMGEYGESFIAWRNKPTLEDVAAVVWEV